jgi:hypothetical protein
VVSSLADVDADPDPFANRHPVRPLVPQLNPADDLAGTAINSDYARAIRR